MARILFVSDAVWTNTGYATVTRHLIPYLAREHEVILLPFAGTVQGGFSKEVFGVEVLPSITSVQDIAYWCHEKGCDVAVILKDPYAVPEIRNLPVFHIMYSPISEEPVPKEWLDIVQNAIRVWVPSRWGVVQYIRAGGSKEKVRYLPHGVSTDTFKPILDTPREELRVKLNPKLKDVDVVIGMVAVNRQRKLIPNQLEAIKVFADNNPDLKVGVYLHTSVTPDGPHGGWYLNAVIETMGLKGKVVFPEQHYYRLGFSEAEMNLVYNAIDVLLELSTEGFGLPIIEAQSAGCPVITLAHGAGPEINFLDLNCRVLAKHYTIRGSWWGIPDPHHAAELIERALSFDRSKIAPKLHEKAKSFDWELIAQQTLKLLEEASEEFMPQKVGGGT
ncbi:MAG: hypothetical protein DRO39_06300 [Thermoprotei archaeon]|nr:MAG: hypothetical protein DRO39_06300 [Thermoprotei archaeon]